MEEQRTITLRLTKSEVAFLQAATGAARRNYSAIIDKADNERQADVVEYYTTLKEKLSDARAIVLMQAESHGYDKHKDFGDVIGNA
jgi:hypothetical protein